MNKNELMILHRFDKSVFFKYYVGFLYNYFDTSNHHFITNQVNSHTLSADDIPMVEHFKTIYTKPIKNIRLFVPYAISRLRMTYKSNLLIIHQMKLSDVFFCLLTPWSLKKTIWVIWGSDLYDYRTRYASFSDRIYIIVKRYLVKRIPYVISNVGDYKLLQKWYGASPKLLQVYSLYGNGCTSVKPHIRQTNAGTINILLGNSSTLTNRHIEGLDILSKYKNEDIKIHIPLSYGDKEYAKSVEKHAREIFGDKVIILDKMMSTESYNDILSTMDIAVFNHNRQQGVGNLTYMFQSGVKIFLNDDNPLCEYYEELNLPVNSINNIPDMSFDEFIFVDPLEVQASTQRARDIFSEETLVKQWNEVFALAKK